MDRQHLIFFLLSVLAWTSETSCKIIRSSEDLISTEVVRKHEGETLQFACSPSNSSAAGELQWWTYHTSLQRIHSNGTRVFALPKENNGQRSVVLTIKNLQPSDSRKYYCMEYINGTYVLTDVRLKLKVLLQDDAAFSFRPIRQKSVQTTSLRYTEGESFEFSCTSPLASPVDLGWFIRVNGTVERIRYNVGRVSAFPSVSNGQRSVVLKIGQLRQSDTNKYYCIDTIDKHRYADTGVRLNLTVLANEPSAMFPTIPESSNVGTGSVESQTEKLESVELEIPRIKRPAFLSLRIEPDLPLEGDVAKLVCTLDVTMSPWVMLRWVRHSKAGTSEEIVLTSPDFSRFSIQFNLDGLKYVETLTIQDLQPSDAGNYGCYTVDTAPGGLNDSANVELSVTSKH